MKGKDYGTLLKELVNVCALCNDSTLGYSEVSSLLYCHVSIFTMGHASSFDSQMSRVLNTLYMSLPYFNKFANHMLMM